MTIDPTDQAAIGIAAGLIVLALLALALLERASRQAARRERLRAPPAVLRSMYGLPKRPRDPEAKP